MSNQKNELNGNGYGCDFGSGSGFVDGSSFGCGPDDDRDFDFWRYF